ncbi:MAG: DUF6965 family protein [Candidatus Thorarchaeota archaeon]
MLNLEEIKQNLRELEIPDTIQLSKHAKIVDPKKFFNNHFAFVQGKMPTFLKEKYESRIRSAYEEVLKYNKSHE